MPYQRPKNNFRSTLASAHRQGDGRLALQPGDGDRLGPLLDYEVYRVTLVDNPESAAEAVLGIFEATGLAGDALTGVTAVEGTADATLAAGTAVRLRPTAKTFADVHAALAVLSAGGGSGGGSGSGATPLPATTPELQALFNTPGGGVYYNPATIRLADPIFLHTNQVELSGSGETHSSYLPKEGASFPLFVLYPVASYDGREVTAANRPDLFGLLDASVAPAAGHAWGFATLGIEAAYYQSGAANLGPWLNATDPSYMQGSDLEWRWAIGFGTNSAYPTNAPCWGYGDASDGNPAPLVVYFGTATGTVDIYVKIQGDARGHERLYRGTFDPTRSRNEFKLQANHTAKTLALVVNGATVSLTNPNGAGDANWGGNYLEKPIRDDPMQFGTTGWVFGVQPSQASADFTLLGWQFDNALTMSPAADHHHAYLNGTSVNCIAYFDTTAYSPGRLLTLREGLAGRNVETRALILDTRANGRTIYPSFITFRGLTLDHSDGAVMLTGNFGLVFDSCSFQYGTMGVGTVRANNNYTIAFTNCTFGGMHVSYSLWNTRYTFEDCALWGGATSAILESGCGGRHGSTILAGFQTGAQPASLVRLLNGATWGTTILEDFLLDDEGFPVDDVFYIESQQAEPRVVYVRGGAFASPCANVFHLATVPNAVPSLIDVRAFAWGTGSSAGTNATILVDGAEWYGSVDTQFNPGYTIAGAGAAAINTRPYAPATGALTITPEKTANYTLAPNEYGRADTTSGSLTFTLPTAPANGTRCGGKIMVQASAHTLTLLCGGSDRINVPGGATSAVMTLLRQGVTLQYDAADSTWVVVGDDLPLSQLDLRYAPLGVVSVASAGALPTPSVANRGQLIVVQTDSASTDDTLYVCAKLINGSYAWREVVCA